MGGDYIGQKEGFCTFFWILISSFIPLLCAADLSADDFQEIQGKTRPKIEVGGALGGGFTPHYIGSNHYYVAALPFPLLAYRTDYFELSRESKVYLYESESMIVDFAFNFRFPIVSDELNEDGSNDMGSREKSIYSLTNQTRKGMDDLPPAVFLGFQSYWMLSNEFLARISFVSGFTTEEGSRSVGSILTPSFEYKPFGDAYERFSKKSISLFFNAYFGDNRYNDFYYSVGKNDVLSDREEYQASGGLISYNFGMDWEWWITEDLKFIGVFMGHSLANSAVKESPLVINEKMYTLGFIISYNFWKSKEKVGIKALRQW